MNDTLIGHRALVQSNDRCDYCAAQAFGRAVKTIDDQEYELLFCGHHLVKYTDKLILEGFFIQDDRHTINVKPMSGAPEDYVESEA